MHKEGEHKWKAVDDVLGHATIMRVRERMRTTPWAETGIRGRGNSIPLFDEIFSIESKSVVIDGGIFLWSLKKSVPSLHFSRPKLNKL